MSTPGVLPPPLEVTLFTARLRVYVVGFTALLFILAFYVIFRFSYRFIREEAVHRADAQLDNTILRIDGVLNSVETAVANSSWAVGEELDKPDSLYTLLTRFVERNPIISGSAVAFREDFFRDKGSYYSPYVFKDANGDIRRRQLGTERYNYSEKEWFSRPMQTGKAHWSEPYYDTGGGEMLMTTYSQPLYDADHRMYGVFTADISLAWLTELVNGIRPYPRSYNLMIGREGTYIVHHRPERILHETIFSATKTMKDSTTQKIGRDMLAGRRGMEVLQNDDLTMLALRLKHDPDSQEMELVLENRLTEILRLEDFVKQAGQRAGIPADETEMVLLAVEEAVTNVIRYAYGDGEGLIRLTAACRDGNLVFELRDSGQAFDPTQVPEADVTLPAEERTPGGLGLLLVRRIMDEVRYQRTDGENRLTLVKKSRLTS